MIMRIFKYIGIIFAIMILSSLALLYFNDIANQNVVITRREFKSEKIPKSFYGTKFMVISDLHDADFSDQIVEHIKKEKPDMVIVMYYPSNIKPIDWSTHTSTFDFR